MPDHPPADETRPMQRVDVETFLDNLRTTVLGAFAGGIPVKIDTHPIADRENPEQVVGAVYLIQVGYTGAKLK